MSRVVDARYLRVVDGTVRCACEVRVVLRRYSYGLECMVDVEEVTAEFRPVFGSAVITEATTWPTFAGESLGEIA